MAAPRLRPTDFTRPEAAATWLALTSLDAAGEPVDFVLLAARLHRYGSHPDYGPGIAPAQLATLSRRGDIAAGHHALTAVTHAALVHAAAQAQQLFATAAADPRRTSDQLLRTARGALERLGAARRRLDDQTGPRPAAVPARPTNTQPTRPGPTETHPATPRARTGTPENGPRSLTQPTTDHRHGCDADGVARRIPFGMRC